MANSEYTSARIALLFAIRYSRSFYSLLTTHYSLHIRIIRPAATLRRHPVDISRGILDVAGLAVHAVLRVDDEARIRARCLVGVDHLVDRGRAVEPRGLAPLRQVLRDRDRRILQLEVDGLVLLVVRTRQEDRG